MDVLVADLLFALRTLRRRPMFTVVAVCTLAIGIGINTAMFNMANPMLFRPLPFAEPEQVVALHGAGKSTGDSWRSLSAPEVLDIREQATSFSSVGAFVRANFNLSSEEAPARVRGAQVEPQTLALLGVKPALGRLFTAEDPAVGQGRVVLISDALWRKVFSADSAVVSRAVRIDGAPATVIGVMPPRFSFPETAQVWTVMLLEREESTRGNHYLSVVGRLKKGVSLVAARDELDGIGRRLATTFPESDGEQSLRVCPWLDNLVPPMVRGVLQMILVAVGLVLLIACANVANLLLARGADRRHEIAIRTALGAGRWPIARLVLAESCVLSLLAGVLGFAVAQQAIHWMLSWVPIEIPPILNFDVDHNVVLFNLAMVVIAAFVAGIVPAIQTSRIDVHAALAEGGRGGSAGASRLRLRRLLVSVQLAMTMVLLCGALLMVRSFLNIAKADLGFRSEDVLHARISLSGDRYRQGVDRVRLVREALAATRNLAGVTASAATSMPPIGQYGWNSSSFTIEGVPRDPKLSQEAETRAITPGYLTTVGSSIVSGRNLDEKEAFESGGVVLISEGMAKRFWPGKDPLGQRLSFGGDTWLRIIAVVADVKQPFDLSGVSDHPVWQVYVSYVENPHSSVSLLLRTQAPPETIGDAMRTAFATVDRDLPLFDVMSLEHMRAQASWIASQWSKTGIIYGVIAMFLSAAGLYGVVAYTVSMRVREIGVRVAMGASRGRVVAFVLHDGLGMMAWGGVTGLAAALLTSRLLSKILYGVAPYDPLTLGAAIALLALTMAVATFIPARRAASVDPSIALRCE